MFVLFDCHVLVLQVYSQLHPMFIQLLHSRIARSQNFYYLVFIQVLVIRILISLHSKQMIYQRAYKKIYRKQKFTSHIINKQDMHVYEEQSQGMLMLAAFIISYYQFQVVQVRKMSSVEKSITISILKAYNWNERNNNESYDLSFYSVLSKGLILQKIIKSCVSNNQLIINASLKITFTPEQSQILMRMSKLEQGKATTFLNEFVIDLELLEERKVQYLPFDKNDKILQVVTGVQSREDHKYEKSVIISSQIDTFIHEKSQYLKSVAVQNGNATCPMSKIENNQNFTQKLYALLQETKKLRQKINRQKKSQLFDNVGSNNAQCNKNSQNLSFNADEIDNGRLLVKSSSENLLTVAKFVSKNGTNHEKEIVKSKKWAVPNHYKLDLKSLAILDPNSIYQDEIKENEDEVLRSKQEGFSSFKNNRHQQSAYLPNIQQNN